MIINIEITDTVIVGVLQKKGGFDTFKSVIEMRLWSIRIVNALCLTLFLFDFNFLRSSLLAAALSVFDLDSLCCFDLHAADAPFSSVVDFDPHVATFRDVFLLLAISVNLGRPV